MSSKKYLPTISPTLYTLCAYWWGGLTWRSVKVLEWTGFLPLSFWGKYVRRGVSTFRCRSLGRRMMWCSLRLVLLYVRTWSIPWFTPFEHSTTATSLANKFYKCSSAFSAIMKMKIWPPLNVLSLRIGKMSTSTGDSSSSWPVRWSSGRRTQSMKIKRSRNGSAMFSTLLPNF